MHASVSCQALGHKKQSCPLKTTACIDEKGDYGRIAFFEISDCDY